MNTLIQASATVLRGKTQTLSESQTELDEAVVGDHIHRVLKAHGYKKDSTENRPGMKKTWYTHPSGKHPITPAELAKHLGHKEGQYPSGTYNYDAGEITSHQHKGGIYVGVATNNKHGDVVKDRMGRGLDN